MMLINLKKNIDWCKNPHKYLMAYIPIDIIDLIVQHQIFWIYFYIAICGIIWNVYNFQN
jgi:hypothetical protein